MALDRKDYIAFYDRILSRVYDLLLKWLFLPFGGERRVRKQLLEPVSFGAGDRILDMCCGTGTATLAIAERAGSEAKVVGLDLSLGQIRRARAKSRRANVRFLVGDAAAAPLADDRFDKVFITHAIHEMLRPARLAALAEARRLLKPGGEVVVFELDEPQSLPLRLFVGFWWFYWLPFNFETPTRRDMFRHGVANEVEESGFREVRKISALRGALQTVTAREHE
jgi:demethylmenaquinone methyltransferase/2-methoxy-6-polyprenyl-1,4-benzoquinol methylase